MYCTSPNDDHPHLVGLPRISDPISRLPPLPIHFDRRQNLHRPIRDVDKGIWRQHSDQAARAEAILGGLQDHSQPTDAGLEPILRVHSADYVEFLRTAYAQWLASGRRGETVPVCWPLEGRGERPPERIEAKVGWYSFDLLAPIAESTWDAAYWSAQTAVSAVKDVLDNAQPAAFALCRPPGHHAGRDYCGGYGYLNNAAIAAEHATHVGKRVAILDIDCHHGNGTQDIFYRRADVLFVSIHSTATYPYFGGKAEESGAGDGQGFNLNLPLPVGSALNEYGEALERALSAIRQFAPDLLVVSFGADTFVDDPFSDFRILTGDYGIIGERIARIGLPLLVVMEGGYDVPSLHSNVAAFLTGVAPG